MALGADEAQRHRVIAAGGLDDRGDQQRGSLVRDVAGDVEAQLRGAWRRHQALPARVDERQGGGVRLLEDRPELAGLAAGQLEVPLVAAVRVAVSVVGGPRGGARPAQGVQLVQQADVRGRVLVAQQQVVEPGPGQVPGHPGAAAAARHQPGLQPEPAGAVVGFLPGVVGGVPGGRLRGVRHQGQLDRQRGARVGGTGVRVVRRAGRSRRAEQRVERLLPRQRGPPGRRGAGLALGLQRLVRRGDDQRRDVRAVEADGAAAVAGPVPQRETRGGAERGRHRPQVAAAVPDGAGEQLLGCLPCHLDDRAAANGFRPVGAARRTDHVAERGKIHVTQHDPLHQLSLTASGGCCAPDTADINCCRVPRRARARRA